MSAYLHSNLCALAQARPTHVLHVPSFILARNRPRPGALWRGAQYHNSPLCVHMRAIAHTFSMLTGSGHCVVLRLHAFFRSRDRSLKPRSTTMLVSTRAFNSEWAKNTWGWRVVSIPKEDARRTDIAACKPVFVSMTTMRWSHSALRLDQGMLLYVL